MTGIWKNTIGYDPYAAGDELKDDEDDARKQEQAKNLLKLARISNLSGVESRGACKKCGMVGHLTFQCRNNLSTQNADKSDDSDDDSAGGEVAPAAAPPRARERSRSRDREARHPLRPSEEERRERSGHRKHDSERERKHKHKSKKKKSKNSSDDREKKHKHKKD
jgi:hypothetical protein